MANFPTGTKMHICNQKFLSFSIIIAKHESDVAPSRISVLCFTVKYSMNNSLLLGREYLSGGGVGAYFVHCLTLKEKRGVCSERHD